MPATSLPALSIEDAAAIREVIDASVPLVMSGDWDHYLELFTDDCVVMPPGSPILKGRAAARTWFEALPEAHGFTSQAVVVDGRGDFAWACGTYSMTHEGAHGEHTDLGKWSCTFRHGDDGVWRIASDCWNVDEGAAFGDAPRYTHRDPLGVY